MALNIILFILQGSPAKSPKRKETLLPEKNKKKPHPPVVKKSGFVTNTNVKPRPISDEDSEAESEINPAKKKNVLGKKPVPTKPPKVLPKNSP